MGVPRFYRWLSERYPLINEKIETYWSSRLAGVNSDDDDFVLETDREFRLVRQFCLAASPVIDCLYLDLNGVLHNATHAQGEACVLNDDTWWKIFNYINHVVHSVKPLRLLYIAIDGVAPRAKMNQQRIRRFKAAVDREKKYKVAECLKELLADSEVVDLDELFREDPAGEAFDPNCITPGTPFMIELMKQLQFFILKQMRDDAIWRDLEVVLSGPDVPGEGEHKIMEYIRSFRSHPQWPNISHALHGLDADLIMLSLMTHEPRFYLLREEVVFGSLPQRAKDEARMITSTPKFHYLSIGLLREYLALDILSSLTTMDDSSNTRPMNPKRFREKYGFDFEAERVIDDFLVIACLAGNDFIPHIAIADIRSGGIDLMLKIYVEHLQSWRVNEPKGSKDDGPWLMKKAGTVNWKTFQFFLIMLGELENDRLCEDLDDQEHMNITRSSRKRRLQPKPYNEFEDDFKFSTSELVSEDDDRTSSEDLWRPKVTAAEDLSMPSSSEVNSEEEEQDSVRGGSAKKTDQLSKSQGRTPSKTREMIQNNGDSCFEGADAIRREFYNRKMGIQIGKEGDSDLDDFLEFYLQGVQWTLWYYYRGVPSWVWYFPYHYPPYITDLARFISARPDFKVDEFILSEPCKPFEQLLSVLPPASKDHVPRMYRSLMSPNSPIGQYFPTTLEIDGEEAKAEWEAIIKLPFIDLDELRAAMAAVDKHVKHGRLSPEEEMANTIGRVFLYNNRSNRPESLEPWRQMTARMLDSAGVLPLPESPEMWIPSSLPQLVQGVMCSPTEVRKLNRGFATGFQKSAIHDTNVKANSSTRINEPSLAPLYSLLETSKTRGRDSPVLMNRLTDIQKFCNVSKETNRVSIFGPLSKKESLCLDLTPVDFSVLSDLNRVLKDQSANIAKMTDNRGRGYYSSNDHAEKLLQNDFDLLPSVIYDYPYRRLGKLIAVSTPAGYIPLHPAAFGVACPRQQTTLICTNDHHELRSDFDWKPVLLEQNDFGLTSKESIFGGDPFERASGSLFAAVRSLGLGFSEIYIEDQDKEMNSKLIQIQKSCDRILQIIRSIFEIKAPRKYPNDYRWWKELRPFSWRSIVLEVLPIEGLCQSFSEKAMPVLAKASRLCFLPMVTFLPAAKMSFASDPCCRSPAQMFAQERVMCTSAGLLSGSVGRVISQTYHRKAPGPSKMDEGLSICAAFECHNSDYQRVYLQQALANYLSQAPETEWYSPKEISRELDIPEDCLMWLVKHVRVRLGGFYDDAVDLGLGIVSMSDEGPLIVPEYSDAQKRSKATFYHKFYFSESVIGAIENLQKIAPNLIPHMKSCMKGGARSSLKVDALLPFDWNKKIERDTGWVKEDLARAYAICVENWLKRQKFRKLRFSLPGALVVQSESVDALYKELRQFTSCGNLVPVMMMINNPISCYVRPLESPTVPHKYSSAIGPGQRVVYAREKGVLPFGSAGTVLGLHKSGKNRAAGDYVELLLDFPWIGCSSLNGRCPSPSGCVVPLNHLLPIQCQ